MSEVPADTHHLKILSAEVVHPIANRNSDGVWVRYEFVNIGTAATTADAGGCVQAAYGNSTIDWVDVHFDPPLEPNGGSVKGVAHIPIHKLTVSGAWKIFVLAANRSGEAFSDERELEFEVRLEEDEGG